MLGFADTRLQGINQPIMSEMLTLSDELRCRYVLHIF